MKQTLLIALLFLPALIEPISAQPGQADTNDWQFRVTPVTELVPFRKIRILSAQSDGMVISGQRNGKIFLLRLDTGADGKITLDTLDDPMLTTVTCMARFGADKQYYFKKEMGRSSFMVVEETKGEWLGDGKPVFPPEYPVYDIHHLSFYTEYLPEPNYYMIFSAQTPKNGLDLFWSKLEKDQWSKPRLFDENINTPADEDYPTVNKDGRLFFSSDRESPDDPAGSTNTWIAVRTQYNSWDHADVNPMPAPFNSPTADYAFCSGSKNIKNGLFVMEQDGKPTVVQIIRNPLTLSPEYRPNYHALLIATDSFTYEQNLSFPVRHARELDTVLTNSYDHRVELLINPTKQQVLQRLDLYAGLTSQECLLIYFIGHGFRIEAPGAGVRYYLSASDSDHRKPETCISQQELLGRIANISAPRHIAFILDACFSGNFMQMGIEDPSIEAKSRTYMATSINSVVPDSSCFTRILIDEIKTFAEKECREKELLTADNLFHRIELPAMDACKRNGWAILPQWGTLPGHEGGKYPFRCMQ